MLLAPSEVPDSVILKRRGYRNLERRIEVDEEGVVVLGMTRRPHRRRRAETASVESEPVSLLKYRSANP